MTYKIRFMHWLRRFVEAMNGQEKALFYQNENNGQYFSARYMPRAPAVPPTSAASRGRTATHPRYAAPSSYPSSL